MRARGLKPAFFKNELLATSDPLYGWIFQGLWCLADRAGRLEDRPRRIHLEVNPGRAFEGTDEALTWLAEHGFIVRYEADGRALIQVANFQRHQNPHVNERPSELPPPPESMVPAPDSETDISGDDSGASTVQAPETTPGRRGENQSEARGSNHSDSGLLTPDCSRSARDARARDNSEPKPNGKSRAPPPDWNSVENLELEWWHIWLAHRRAEKRPPYKTTRVAQALARYPPEVQRAAIEQSMDKGWQGLFPEKIDAKGNGRGPGANRFAEHQDRLREWLDDAAGGP